MFPDGFVERENQVQNDSSNSKFSHVLNHWLKFADGAPPQHITDWKDAPSQRYSHASTGIGGMLFISHGYFADFGPNWLSDTWAYDLLRGHWEHVNVVEKNHAREEKKKKTIEKPADEYNVYKPSKRYCLWIEAEASGRSFLLFGGQGPKMHHSGDTYATGEPAANDVWRLWVAPPISSHLESDDGTIVNGKYPKWEKIIDNVVVDGEDYYTRTDIPMGRFLHGATLVQSPLWKKKWKEDLTGHQSDYTYNEAVLYTLGGQGDRRKLHKKTIEEIARRKNLHRNKFTNRLGDFWKLNLMQKKWTRLPSPFGGENVDAAIWGHSMLNFDIEEEGVTALIVYGGSIRGIGYSDIELSNGDVWRFDIEMPNTRKNSLESKKGEHGMWRALSSNGTKQWKFVSTSIFEKFGNEEESVKNRVTNGNDNNKPLARTSHAAAGALGMMFIYGGDARDGAQVLMLSDIWQYDVRKDMWKEIQLKASPTHSRAVIGMKFSSLSTYGLQKKTRVNSRTVIDQMKKISKSTKKVEEKNEKEENNLYTVQPRNPKLQKIASCVQYPNCRDPPRRYRHSMSFIPLKGYRNIQKGLYGILAIFGGESMGEGVAYAYQNDVFGIGVYEKV
eukprot:g3175.t1